MTPARTLLWAARFLSGTCAASAAVAAATLWAYPARAAVPALIVAVVAGWCSWDAQSKYRRVMARRREMRQMFPAPLVVVGRVEPGVTLETHTSEDGVTWNPITDPYEREEPHD